LVQPSARMAAMARLRMLAMFCGAFLVRTREASSP
jgi:hypothetical protein